MLKGRCFLPSAVDECPKKLRIKIRKTHLERLCLCGMSRTAQTFRECGHKDSSVATLWVCAFSQKVKHSAFKEALTKYSLGCSFSEYQRNQLRQQSGGITEFTRGSRWSCQCRVAGEYALSACQTGTYQQDYTRYFLLLLPSFPFYLCFCFWCYYFISSFLASPLPH
jgi:hypothetical protein